MSSGQRVKFYGTTFSAVSAWGAANALTGITNANPAVVNDTAHGFLDGDLVKITGALGMLEVNDVVAVVEAIDANSYSLVGIDSTNWGIYTSGASAQKATFSASCEVTGYDGGSGTTTEIESETNCAKTIDFGSPDPGSVTINFNHAPTAFKLALEASRKSVATTCIKTVLPNSKGTSYDIGSITQCGFAGSAGGLWTGNATLRRITDRVDQ